MSDTNTLDRPVTQSVNSSEFTPEQLHERMIHRRAVEAIVWGMPAVNFDLMHQAMAREVNGGWNQMRRPKAPGANSAQCSRRTDFRSLPPLQIERTKS